MDWTWRIVFLVAAATGKGLPGPSDEKGIKSSQRGFHPLLCPPHRCSLPGAASAVWGWGEEAWSSVKVSYKALQALLCSEWNKPMDKALSGLDGSSRAMVTQAMHRTSRPESTWPHTCLRAQPTWSWAAWDLRTWPCIAVWETQCENPHPESVKNPRKEAAVLAWRRWQRLLDWRLS